MQNSIIQKEFYNSLPDWLKPYFEKDWGHGEPLQFYKKGQDFTPEQYAILDKNWGYISSPDMSFNKVFQGVEIKIHSVKSTGEIGESFPMNYQPDGVPWRHKR